MSKLKENLEYEINWRMGEIAVIKKLLKSDKLNSREVEIIKKYSIASIYSIWEGFIVKSFEYYIEEINNLNLKIGEINLNILTHTIDSHVQLENGRKEFGKKCKFITQLLEYMSYDTVVIAKKVPTYSNVNSKVVNNIFECFNFGKRLDKKFEPELNYFLMIRNDIAHGEFSIVVDEEKIYAICSLVINLMSEIALIILAEYQNKNYLRFRNQKE